MLGYTNTDIGYSVTLAAYARLILTATGQQVPTCQVRIISVGVMELKQTFESLDTKLGLKKKKNERLLPLRTGTWNVRTMQTYLDNVDLSHGHIQKTAVIDRELSRLNLDIVVLQEIRIADSRSL